MPKLASNWIISKSVDLRFLIGSVLLSFAMFFLAYLEFLGAVAIWFWWNIVFDSPHFYATYVRTFFDSKQFKQKKLLFGSSFIFFLIGPGVIAISLYFKSLSSFNERLPFVIFVSLFNLWAYWHLVRQHFGLIVLYRKKAEEKTGFLVDKWTFHLLMASSLVFYAVSHSETAMQFQFLEKIITLDHVKDLSVITAGVSFLIFASWQLQSWLKKNIINVPKCFLFIAASGLHLFVCMSKLSLTMPLIVFIPVLGVFHNVQYQALVWFYSQKSYHTSEKQGGYSKFLTKNLSLYIGIGIVVSFLLHHANCFFGAYSCWFSEPNYNQILDSSFIWGDLLFSFVLGVPMQHYFLDQNIWKFSKDNFLSSRFGFSDYH